MKRLVLPMFLFFGFVGFGLFSNNFGGIEAILREPVKPDWQSIAAWPPDQAGEVDAEPDPNRNFTAIVFDDSSSMSDAIRDARTAVIASLDAMQDEDRLTVIALNEGEVIPFMSVNEARNVLPAALAQVRSEGRTPLTRAVRASREALAAEAAVAGGFGTYRILVTTDGEADNGQSLTSEIEDIARTTPIQVATIGVGIQGSHVLRRSDLAAFVAIDNVSQLAEALRETIAEEQVFSAITSFGGN